MVKRESNRKKKNQTTLSRLQKVEQNFHGKISSGGVRCYGKSYIPSQPCRGTIYTVSTTLYLYLLQEWVACHTIPCPSYCISCNKNPFFFYERVDFPFHSSTIKYDFIPFKDAIVINKMCWQIIYIQYMYKQDVSCEKKTFNTIKQNKPNPKSNGLSLERLKS